MAAVELEASRRDPYRQLSTPNRLPDRRSSEEVAAVLADHGIAEPDD
jgi:hypothetical protein